MLTVSIKLLLALKPFDAAVDFKTGQVIVRGLKHRSEPASHVAAVSHEGLICNVSVVSHLGNSTHTFTQTVTEQVPLTITPQLRDSSLSSEYRLGTSRGTKPVTTHGFTLLPPHVQSDAPDIYFGHPFCHVKESILFAPIVMLSLYVGKVVISAPVGRKLLVKRFTVVPQHGPLGLQQLPRQLPSSEEILVICAVLVWKTKMIIKAIFSAYIFVLVGPSRSQSPVPTISESFANSS